MLARNAEHQKKNWHDSKRSQTKGDFAWEQSNCEKPSLLKSVSALDLEWVAQDALRVETAHKFPNRERYQNVGCEKYQMTAGQEQSNKTMYATPESETNA